MDADGFGELPLRFACRIKAAGADTGDERLGVYTEPVIERDWLEIAMNDGGGREFIEFSSSYSSAPSERLCSHNCKVAEGESSPLENAKLDGR